MCVCGVGKDVLRRQEGRHHVGQRALMPPSAQRWPLACVTVPASPAWCGEAGPCELLGVQPKGAGLQRAWGGERRCGVGGRASGDSRGTALHLGRVLLWRICPIYRGPGSLWGCSGPVAAPPAVPPRRTRCQSPSCSAAPLPTRLGRALWCGETPLGSDRVQQGVARGASEAHRRSCSLGGLETEVIKAQL